MNRNFKSDIYKVLATRRLYFLAALVVLFIPQLGRAQSCTAELQDLRDWVKQVDNTYVYDLSLVMVTNRADGKVATYSKGTLSGNGSASVKGEAIEYFSDRFASSYTDHDRNKIQQQPFAQNKTDKLNIKLDLNSGEIRFTKTDSYTVASPECFNGVMFWHTGQAGYLVSLTKTKETKIN